MSKTLLIDYYGQLTKQDKAQAWGYINAQYKDRKCIFFNDLFKSYKQRNFIRSKGDFSKFEYILVISSLYQFDKLMHEKDNIIFDMMDRLPYPFEIVDVTPTSYEVYMSENFETYTESNERAKCAFYANALGYSFENKPFYERESTLNELFAPSPTDRRASIKPHKYRATKAVVSDNEIDEMTQAMKWFEKNGGIEAWLDYPYKLCKSCGRPFKAYENESLCADCGGIEQEESCIDRCNYDVAKGVYVPW